MGMGLCFRRLFSAVAAGAVPGWTQVLSAGLGVLAGPLSRRVEASTASACLLNLFSRPLTSPLSTLTLSKINLWC